MLEPEKKFNSSNLIGFILISLLFFGYLYLNAPTQEEKDQAAAKAKTEALAKENKENSTSTLIHSSEQTTDSLATDSLQNSLKEEFVTFTNEELNIKLTNKGAQLKTVELKKWKAYSEKDSKHKKPLLLFDNNSAFDIELQTASGKTLHTSDLIFKSQTTQKDSLTEIRFSTNIEGGSLYFIYTLHPKYEIDFNIESKGIKFAKNSTLDWKHMAFQLEKGRKQEEIYTDFHYAYKNYEKTNYDTNTFEADSEQVLNWICNKQQFFLTILESKNGFKNSTAEVARVDIEEKESPYIKDFSFKSELENGKTDINESFTWYFLPMHLDILNTYEGKSFDDLVPFDYFGSVVIGWLNKHFFYTMYKVLSDWGLAAGWIILLMTVIIKLILSPVMYKQHKQSAMMRTLKPEIAEINEKYKNDALKKQQASMELNRKAGVNPLSGCLPALIQIPLFLALFRLFPNIIQLRGKSFLWADDLTSYDSIFSWTTHIPVLSSFYGNHISLFALLYAVVLIAYTKLNANNVQQPQQEGLPNLQNIMYIMPLLFVFFLNSYASGLSWYYVVSNFINIIIILVIKYYFIDEKKIHALVEANKQKAPKKGKSKFQRIMEQAAEQQRAQKNNKK